MISRQEGSAASYYIYDGGLSVRALTNEAGTVTDTLVFDAFGNETAKTGSTDNSYGFQGEEKDETGLYYLRARYMDPSTGTFTSMDTYGGSLSDPMSLHKYLFANSNPVMYCDHNGHDASLLNMVGAMGIGAILAAASYLALWAISSVVDTFRGTNYSAGYSLKGLICSVVMGALLGGLGWEFSIAFQAMHLTFMQYVGLSVFLILIGLDLKVWSYFEGKSGDVIWSAILGTLGDVSYVASGASVGAAVNARNNPLGHHNYGNGDGNSRDSNNTPNSNSTNNNASNNADNRFPRNPDDFMPEIPRGKVVNGNGTQRETIYPSEHVRIRAEQHPLQPGEVYNPRHHGVHYHVEIRTNTSLSWNNSNNVQKVYPNNYTPGSGTGFLPGEKFPGT